MGKWNTGIIVILGYYFNRLKLKNRDPDSFDWY